MHLYSLFIVTRRWGLLFHASCVAHNGVCQMFAGPSGAGKSTAALLSRPRGIVADEATIVRIRSDGAVVFHSPFRSDIQCRAAGEERAWPLGGIHFLRQADRHRRVGLSKTEGFLLLAGAVFFWKPTPKETGAILELLLHAAKQVPLYELFFRKDPEFWEMIS